MFTGLITGIGTILSAADKPDGRLLTIATPWKNAPIAVGASIACDGVCLTATRINVTENGTMVFDCEAGAETLALTTAGTWHNGHQLNLERSLKIGDELGGHLVSGHVDGLATITDTENLGDNVRFTIKPPEELNRFIARKGSITLNGTSLTINTVSERDFTVCLIPHTLEVTTWQKTKTGDQLNIEVDQLARYADRLLNHYN